MTTTEYVRHSMSFLAGTEGVLFTLAPIPLLFPFIGGTDLVPFPVRMTVAVFTSAAALTSSLLMFKKPFAGKFFGIFSLVSCFLSLLPFFAVNPFAALCGTVGTIGGIFGLLPPGIPAVFNRKSDRALYRYRHARWTILALPAVAGFHAVFFDRAELLSTIVGVVASLLAFSRYASWSLRNGFASGSVVALLGAALVGMTVALSQPTLLSGVLLLCFLVAFAVMPAAVQLPKNEHWWEELINQPTRMLLVTFLLLCIGGTLLLRVPFAAANGKISLLDAAFTSVSAVCVTGLTTVDTARGFTVFGQIMILLCIQLGGLGIMSITTVALHVMGRRISLRQERLLNSITDTDHHDLLRSLSMILIVTVSAECAGALLLSMHFAWCGDSPGMALWRGLFTAVSAFCNAGFALQGDSLAGYADQPAILYAIAVLIIIGGMAPATSLLIPRWLSGKPVSVSVRITLWTTVVLLAAGMVLYLVMEWDGVLAGLPVAAKIHNALFQSVTLRTAGFNSVPVAAVSSPTYLLMLFFMFIGGSPGGTAGGVKTTTFGVLAMTFWANITNRSEVIAGNRRVPPATVYRAVTITVSGLIIWAIAVLMLSVTQDIPSRDLIFEATSALGTVGLSTGITNALDEIGKIIIMITMFAGRIGPMTLFMLLGRERVPEGSRCPDAKINLT